MRLPQTRNAGVLEQARSIFNVGYRHVGARFRLLRGRHRLRLCLRTVVKERAMIFDYTLAGIVSAGLLFYLTYALLRPERF